VAFGRAIAASNTSRAGVRVSGPWRKPSKKVERAAVRAAQKWLEARGYKVQSRESKACGYDLLASHTRLGELHVEVKGTAGSQGHFYLTHNEHLAAMADPRWRLPIITDAVLAPRLRMLRRYQMVKSFAIEPVQWEGVEIPT